MPIKKTVQSSITFMVFPLLQKPREMCPGRQIGVPGKFWTFHRGRMLNEEENTFFKCTVCGFHALHKWAGGGVPSQAMELQEMGVDGQHSTEPGKDDKIFFMKYPLPQHCHWSVLPFQKDEIVNQFCRHLTACLLPVSV